MPYQFYAEIERKYNRPMADILLDLLPLHGEEKTAEMLGVTVSTIWSWTRKSGVEYVCRWQRIDDTLVTVHAAPSGSGRRDE